MRHARSLLTQTALAFAFVLFFSLMAAGQQAAIVPARITHPVDLENLVTLRGNTHPLARPEYDQGAAPDSLPTERMLLVLQRSAEQEAALRKLLDEQQIKSSPNYHMWLTPEQFGQQFGPADADIQAVTGWLTSQGFQVSHVAAGRTVIEFSGTAGQVREAFHTEIHKFLVKGEEHWANASDPQIPAALTPVVAGFASLNNFPRKPMSRRLGTFSKSKATGVVRPLFTFPYNGGYLLAVGPADFATIYNVTPLYASTDGSGQIIAIVGETNINCQDVADFRTMFGLPYTAKSPTDPCPSNLNIVLNGPDPGILFYTGDETETDTDVEWAGAVAKGATIDLVVSETTEVTYGVDLSALYIIDNNLAPIMSESYGACETDLGNSGNAFYSTLWEQGAAQGITLLMASGDHGSAGCDTYGPSYEIAAQFGLAVSGFASTPFNIAVGGTDFNDSNWQQYWTIANTSPQQSSAISYIPEMTWNDSCANAGASGCASVVISSDGTDLVAGGGGPSAVYARPSWQTGPGVFSSHRARDTPDVSLFAGDGMNFSFYVFCEMDANTGSTSSCDLSAPYLDFQGAGGTSVSAQAFGGIMALVNQRYGRQGNANYVLYPLAAQTGASCNSTALPANSSSCTFYDVTSGNNSVACVGGSPNCSNTNSASGNYGILEVNPPSNSAPAWATATGYDLATGLGTVNVANLVNNWTSVSFTPTSTTLAITPPTGYTLTNIPHGQPVTVTVNVSPASATGDVSLIDCGNLTSSACAASNNNLGIDFGTLSNGALSGTTVMLPGGTYGVMARYAGNGTDGSSNSTPPVQVTVSAEPSKTLVQLATEDCSGNITYSTTATVPYGDVLNCSGYLYLGYWLRVDVTNSSGTLCAPTSPTGVPFIPTGVPTIPPYQCPTGQVTVKDNGQPPPDLGAPSGTPGNYTLNSQGNAEDYFIQLPGGSNALVASYAGDTSYNASTPLTQGTATITVTQAPTSMAAVSASNTGPTSGQSVTLTALVSTTSIGVAPTGAVQFLNSNVPMTGSSCGSPCTLTYTPVNASASGYASLTATLITSFTANASITAQYVADLNYSASSSYPTYPATTITISTGTPDFSLVANPTSFGISAPGASGSTTIEPTAISGFTGTVSLSCAVPSAMTGGSCLLASTSLIPGNTTTLTVYTTAPSTVIGPFNSPRWLVPLGGAIFAAFFLLIVPTKRRRLKLAFGSLFLVLLAAALVACGGGGGGGGGSTPPSGGTPPGNYTVTVTGTSGSLSHGANVTVNVQ